MQCCTDKGYVVTFKDNICLIKKGNTLVTFSAKIDKGLYKLKIIPSNGNAYAASEIIVECTNVNCISKWHQRLGYRSFDAIKKIQKDDSAVDVNINNCHTVQSVLCVLKQNYLKNLTQKKKNTEVTGYLI